MASVKWSVDALGDLENIDTVVAKRIVEKTIWLEKNFTDVVPERLHGRFADFYKLRVGDYRIIYSIRSEIITIQMIKHRRDAYR